MKQELYFDISSEEKGGSLYRLPNGSFVWHHSVYNEALDETQVFQTPFGSFALFWQMLTQDAHWYYQHPLFVHPEVRPFVQQQLQHANWTVQGNAKWQISHQRQWTKVLGSGQRYYRDEG